MFSIGPSCKGKVAISLGFSFAFQRGRKIRGWTHGKKYEGNNKQCKWSEEKFPIFHTMRTENICITLGILESNIDIANIHRA